MRRPTWLALPIVACVLARTVEAARREGGLLRRRGIWILGTLLAQGLGAPALASSPQSPVSLRVTTSPTFFNPTIGQWGEIRVSASVPGTAQIEVLDRDRFVVRRLSAAAITSSETITRWNGRDDAGEVLPDEAYTVRVRVATPRGEVVYDPGEEFHPRTTGISSAAYSRADGVLSYRLDRPSRIHAQAGQAQIAGGRAEGPVLRTLVDREPRAGGAVIEAWNGFDQSGQVYVPDLPNFVVAVLAEPLPEGTLITVGNRSDRFEEYARQHRPPTLSEPRPLELSQHAHHQGLNAFEDHSPSLALEALSPSQRVRWLVKDGQTFSLLARLEEQRAPFFLSQPTRLHVFVDFDRVASLTCTANPCRVDLPPSKIPKGTHRVVANWASDLGPVSVALHLLEKK